MFPHVTHGDFGEVLRQMPKYCFMGHVKSDKYRHNI